MKRKITNLIFGLIFLSGLGLLTYPTFSNWWNQMHQSRAVGAYVEQVEDMSVKQKEQMYKDAVVYNENLLQSAQHFELSTFEDEEYNKTLDVTGTGIMGYVDIPKISVKLPIYHGTESTILQVAVGHIAGTSLPIGGESTHAVLSGHSGLPSARLFTDLNKLKAGDYFNLNVLDDTLTYEVDQIRIVLPNELEDLKIVKGKDYCTLVTCTPYGINTHRLLVRGHRIDQTDLLAVKQEAVQLNTRFVAAFLAAIIAIFAFLLFDQDGKVRRSWLWFGLTLVDRVKELVEQLRDRRRNK